MCLVPMLAMAACKLEVVVDGRPLFGGVQSAVAAEMDGVAILAVKRAKERRYPELAKVRALSETPLMQRRVEQAWECDGSWLFGCAAAKAVAASLLEMQGCVTDGASPAGHEVEGTSVIPALPRMQVQRTLISASKPLKDSPRSLRIPKAECLDTSSTTQNGQNHRHTLKTHMYAHWPDCCVKDSSEKFYCDLDWKKYRIGNVAKDDSCQYPWMTSE